MNHPAEIAALKAEMAELRKIVGNRPAELTAEEAERLTRQGVVARGGDGRVLVNPEMDRLDGPLGFEARDRERKRAADVEAAAYEAKIRAGLPSGLYRDPMGLVRHVTDGKIADAMEVAGRPDEAPEAIARATFDRMKAAEHHKFLEENHLIGDGADNTWPDNARYPEGADSAKE
jgi:hypothetical protein